jgi:hypothetical protein
LIVAGSEDDDASLVADKALGDADLASVGRVWARPLHDELGVDDLDDEVMAGGSGLELIHRHENRLAELRLRLRLLLRLLLLLLRLLLMRRFHGLLMLLLRRRRRRRLRSHGSLRSGSSRVGIGIRVLQQRRERGSWIKKKKKKKKKEERRRMKKDERGFLLFSRVLANSSLCPSSSPKLPSSCDGRRKEVCVLLIHGHGEKITRKEQGGKILLNAACSLL